MDDIEDKISDFEKDKDKVNYCLVNMTTYRKYLNLTSQKLTLLENYENTLMLMNNRVEDEEYDKAVTSCEDIIQIFFTLKPIAYQMSNLSILDYSEEILGIWDMYIDSWEVYKEYLNLLIDGKYGQAESKYDEYSDIYDDILAIENTDNLNENNSEIDNWYTTHIGIYLDLFEEYSR